MNATFALFNLSPWEIMILLGLGVLLFGRKLPEMGKVLGKSIVELKKGISGMEDEWTNASSASPRIDQQAPAQAPRPPQRINATAPKFEDPNENITAPPKV
jgi:sec-independent protein translocase protein TatA